MEAVILAVPGLTAVILPPFETTTTLLLSVFQETVLSVAFSGRTVAVRSADSPSVNSRVWGLMLREETGIMTVISQVAVFSPSTDLTVMVAVPASTAVTLPLLLTVATEASLEDQVIDLSVAFSGRTVAIRLAVSPFGSSRVVGDTVTEETCTLCTETAQVAVLWPSSVVTVMVAFPAFTAVTTPFWSMVATEGLLEDQVIFLFVALEGVNTAETVVTSSTPIERVEGEMATLFTGAIIVKSHMPFFPPQDAIMATRPACLAVTTPFSSTVAFAGFNEDQVTVLSVAFSGYTVALSVTVSPSLRVCVAGETTTEVTSIGTTCIELNALKPPSTVVAVTRVLPRPTAVTIPLASTVAMLSSLEVQVTALLVAPSG